MAIERAAIVAAARAWIGTPYHHQASLRGVGCDCLGLVRGVWREIYGEEPETPPPYGPNWGETGSVEHLHDAANRHLVSVELSQANAGDVLLFRMRDGAMAKHLAVLSSPATLVHALSGDRVREETLSAYWRRHVVGAFSFPGTVD